MLPPFKGLRRNAASDLAPCGYPEAVAQELAAPHPRHRTLVLVDPEPELRVPLPQGDQHSISRSLRPHVHIAVIGVADERMPASFQFLVHFVQEHVRQQR